MRSLPWAAIALVAGPTAAEARRDGGGCDTLGSCLSASRSASRQDVKENSATAELVRLRGGILGVDLVHEIAKTFLLPSGGQKGSGARGGGGGGGGDDSGGTDGAKGDRTAGVARVEDGSKAGSDADASVANSNKNADNKHSNNKDVSPSSGPKRVWEGLKLDKLPLPPRTKARDNSNANIGSSNHNHAKSSRGSDDTGVNGNDSAHFPGLRGSAAAAAAADQTEPDHAGERTEPRFGSAGAGAGGGEGDEEEPTSVHEQIERLRAALEAAGPEREAHDEIVVTEGRKPVPYGRRLSSREHGDRQEQGLGVRSGSADRVVPLAPSSDSGLPELHQDENGDWEWEEKPNGSYSNGNNVQPNNANGLADAAGRVEEDVDVPGYTGSGGGGGWGDEDGDEEDDDEMHSAIAAARAAAAAARAREEIAFLREIEAVSEQAAQNAGMPPPLGQHVKAVVTKDVPFRFADELGAQIATALAMAVFKGVTHTLLAHRGEKKPEKVAFSDVVGCDEAKDEIKQIVDFLVDPAAYDKLGAKRPKGILLVGPPGTGKTLIAKACAGEAGVPFLYACGSDFNGIFVGMGVAAVKRLFAKARRHKKSIIYIDEIDYLGRSRNSGARDASGATQDREATLNQLLSEMDGFEGKDGIVVMASTNRKDILDDALLRSGRFDMQVDVERPDRNGREQLFSKYIAPLKLSDRCANAMSDKSEAKNDKTKLRPRVNRSRPGRSSFGGGAAAIAATEAEKEAEMEAQGIRDELAKELADLTPYMTGADVANVCATAGRIAARAGSGVVSLEHFSAAVDRVCNGLEKPGKLVSKDEQRRTAVHEAGHAVIGWMLPWCDPVVKVSIVWRGNALGFSQSAMTERLSDMRETVLDNVCMALAGRAAEEVVFGTISGGASSDLKKASRALYIAITENGFGNTTGLLSPGDRFMSEKVMAEVDQEVRNLLAEQYERAKDLIRQYRDKINLLSDALVDKGVVHKGELEAMLGEKVALESTVPAAPVPAGADDISGPGCDGIPVSAGGLTTSVGGVGTASGGDLPCGGGVARVVDHGIYRSGFSGRAEGGVTRLLDSDIYGRDFEERLKGKQGVVEELEIATRMRGRRVFSSVLRSVAWKQPVVWFACRSVVKFALSKVERSRAAATTTGDDGVDRNDPQ